MTVIELFDHFDFLPDKIVYFDEKENVQDTVYVMRITAEGEYKYDAFRYTDFVNEYGDREVTDWKYRHGDVMHIKMGGC